MVIDVVPTLARLARQAGRVTEARWRMFTIRLAATPDGTVIIGSLGASTIFRAAHKLPPAHYLTVRDGGRTVGTPQCYWNLPALAQSGVRSATGTPQALTDELDALLRDAVARRMVADVPLGAFLSGGFDSTTVVALMQAQSARPVRTFTIGFHEQGYDESQHAKAVARHLGTDHTELYVTPAEALAVIPKLPTIYDEPFSDSSQIPTFLVSQLARRHVTVALSGDGGDELFCGYNRYVMGQRIWQKLRLLPLPARRVVAFLLRNAPGQALDALQRGVLPARLRLPNLGDRLPKLAEVLEHRDGAAFYRTLVSHWKDPERLVLDAREPRTVLSDPDRLPALPGLRERMMLLDMLTYLPDDILTKVDRASMANSLEVRCPMLDYRFAQWSAGLLPELKLNHGTGKYLLKKACEPYVSDDILYRPKQGFSVPLAAWFRGVPGEIAEALDLPQSSLSFHLAHLKRAVAIFAEIGADAGEMQPEIWKLVEW